MDFTPASNVLSHPFTGRLRPRHFAGECAHEPLAVSLLDSTMSKGEVQRIIFLFREIYFEYRSRLGECHLAPALRPCVLASPNKQPSDPVALLALPVTRQSITCARGAFLPVVLIQRASNDTSARRKLGGANGERCRAEPSRGIAANRTSIGTTQPTRAGRSGGGASDAARSFGKLQVGDEARGSPPVGQYGFEKWRLSKRKRRQKESSSW